MNNRWITRPVEKPETVERVRRDLNDLPEALARVLVTRGIETREQARRFFRPSTGDLHDPFRMAGMERAAARVAEAIEKGERVLVYGDYDVDGTTSTAMMTHFLRSRGVDARFFIPDRFEHGYGLCEAGLDEAAEQGAALVVALDCGITATAEAAYAREQGLDLVICDHHTVSGDALPDALAVLDPKRPDCGYPFEALSGCGVGFKLVQAVLQQRGAAPQEALQQALAAYGDLLAVSIASDIVPLHGENRILMREGLERLRHHARPGLRALAKTAGVTLPNLTGGRIVFTLGPRINAAGRLDRATRAVKLLLAENEQEARPLAERLDKLNTKRRALDRATAEKALKQARRHLTARSPHALVLFDENWHEGVIGIVASSVVEALHRPTVMLTAAGDGRLKGSARSVSGINVYDALSACADLLEQFGGHDYAAGLTLRRERLDAFRERFDAAVGEQITSEDVLRPTLKVDAPIRLGEIGALDGRFWAVLKQFAPHGPANAKPVFRAQNLAPAQRPRRVGKSKDHLKFSVRPADANGSATAMDAIGFGMGEKIEVLRQSQKDGTPLELLFSLEENTFRGRTTLQLKARDVRLQEDVENLGD